jgi:hypothetical protein
MAVRPIPLLFAAAALAQVSAPALAQAAPRTFSVANPAELWQALVTARGGDTILLAPGDYGNVKWDRFRYTGGHVNIRSADPANRARFGRMLLYGASNISVSGIDAASSLNPVVAISGSDVRFTGNRIRGAVANQDPWDDSQTGVWVRFANRVMVASNDFQDLRLGVYIQRSFDVALRHNSFTHLREGVNVASVTRGDISHNFFHAFSPRYNAGEHPDAIQFWNHNEPYGSTDVTLRNNYMALSNTGAIHGFFIGNENPALPHSRFEISGNIYYGSALHGISLGKVNDARVFNNTVVASPWADMNNSRLRSEDGKTGGAMQPQIRMGSGTGVQAFRNIAMNNFTAAPGNSASDNIDIFEGMWRRGEPWEAAFVARPTATLPPVSAFVTKDPSAAATRQAGVLAPFRAGVVTLDPVEAQAFGASQPMP